MPGPKKAKLAKLIKGVFGMPTSPAYKQFRFGKVQNDRSPEDVLECSPLKEEWPEHELAVQAAWMETRQKEYYTNFSIAKDAKHMAMFIAKLPTDQKQYATVIRPDRKVQLYLDVDRKLEKDVPVPCTKPELVDAVYRSLGRFLKERHNIQLKESDLFTFATKNQKKDSFHIHVPKLVWKNIRHLHKFMQEWKGRIEVEHGQTTQQLGDATDLMTTIRKDSRALYMAHLDNPHVIDFVVYHAGRNFRLPYNRKAKPGQNTLQPTPQLLAMDSYSSTTAEAGQITFSLNRDVELLLIAMPHALVAACPELVANPLMEPEFDEAPTASKVAFAHKSTASGMGGAPPSNCQFELALPAFAKLLKLAARTCYSHGHKTLGDRLDNCQVHEGARRRCKVQLDGSILVPMKDNHRQGCPHSALQHSHADCGIATIQLKRERHYLLQMETRCFRGTCRSADVGLRLQWKQQQNGRPMLVVSQGADRIELSTDETYWYELMAQLTDVRTHFTDSTHSFPEPLSHSLSGKVIPSESCITYCERYFRQDVAFSDDLRSIFLCGPCGTGKTETACTIIKSALKNVDTATREVYYRLLLDPTPRISIAETHRDKFKAHGIPVDCYTDLTPSEQNQSRSLVLCVDSLIHLSTESSGHSTDDPSGGPGAPYILFLDEVSSLLKHINNSSTLDRKRIAVVEKLKYFIREARYLLVVDADLNDSNINQLMQFRNPSTSRLIVNKPVPGANAKMYRGVAGFDEGSRQLLQAITDNKRVYVACDQKTQAEKLYAHVKEQRPTASVLLYTGASEAKHKRTIGQCNTYWLDFQVVIASPVITMGVDFNPPNPHFHKCMTFLSCSSVDAQGAFQMMERPRRLIDNEVLIFFRRLPAPSHPPSVQDVERRMQQLGQDFTNNLLKSDGVPQIQRELIRGKYAPTGQFILDLTDWFTLLQRDSAVEQAQSKAYFLDLLATLIHRAGGSLELLPAPLPISTDADETARRAAHADHIRIAADIDAEKATQIVEAPLISEEQSIEYQNIRERTHAQTVALEKYHLVRCFGNPAPDAAFVEEYGSNDMQKRFNCFAGFCKLQSARNGSAAFRVDTDGVLPVARQTLRVQYIYDLAEDLGIPIKSAPYYIPVDQAADKNLLETIQKDNKYMACFGQCARFRRKKPLHHHVITWFARLIDSVLPPGVLRKSQRAFPKDYVDEKTGRMMTKLDVYQVQWNMHALLQLLQQRRKYRNEDAYDDLEPWASPDGWHASPPPARRSLTFSEAQHESSPRQISPRTSSISGAKRPRPEE